MRKAVRDNARLRAEQARVQIVLPELMAASAMAVATIESLRVEVADLRKAQGGVG